MMRSCALWMVPLAELGSWSSNFGVFMCVKWFVLYVLSLRVIQQHKAKEIDYVSVICVSPSNQCLPSPSFSIIWSQLCNSYTSFMSSPEFSQYKTMHHSGTKWMYCKPVFYRNSMLVCLFSSHISLHTLLCFWSVHWFCLPVMFYLFLSAWVLLLCICT